MNSMKIILIQLMPQATNAFFLQFYSSEIRLTSTSSSIRSKLRATIMFSLIEINSRPFSSRFLEYLPYL